MTESGRRRIAKDNEKQLNTRYLRLSKKNPYEGTNSVQVQQNLSWANTRSWGTASPHEDHDKTHSIGSLILSCQFYAFFVIRF